MWRWLPLLLTLWAPAAQAADPSGGGASTAPTPVGTPAPVTTPAPTPGAPAPSTGIVEAPVGALTILQKGRASFPAEARRAGASAGGCLVRVYFDEQGVPYRALPQACDEVWVAPSVAAALQYRIAPFLVDGVARKVKADFGFVYALEGAPATLTPGGAAPAPTAPTAPEGGAGAGARPGGQGGG